MTAARRPLLAVFFGFALIELALLPPGIKTIDEHSMYAVANSLVTGDGFTVPCDPSAIPGRDGCYSPWYPLLSVLTVPFAALAHLIGSVTDASPVRIGHALGPAVAGLSAAGAATFTTGIARRLGAAWPVAVLTGVAFAFGTEGLTYARSFYAETLCALLAAGAVYLLAPGGEPPPRGRRWGYAALALAVLAKPPMVVVGPAIGLGRAIAARDPRKVIAPSLASAAGVVAYMAFNWLRFNDALNFGGESRQVGGSMYLSWDAVEALGLFTISPGRGLLWFSPVAVLGAIALARRRRDPLPLCCGLVSLAILFVYLPNPGIGDNWATRYLVPALPLLCAGLVLLDRRWLRLAVVLVVVGAVIQVPTTLSFYARYFGEIRDAGGQPADVYWSVRRTPLVQSWPAMDRQLEAAADTDVRTLLDEPEAPLDVGQPIPPVEQQELGKVVALWWWMLPIVGVPQLLGLGVALAMIAAGVALLRGVARAGPPQAPA